MSLCTCTFSCGQGKLLGVTGKVGSGKSSLLAAITAEMRRIQGQVLSLSHTHMHCLHGMQMYIHVYVYVYTCTCTSTVCYMHVHIYMYTLQVFIDNLDEGVGLVTQVTFIHTRASRN